MSTPVTQRADAGRAFGTTLRRYRAARRVSQLDLALTCDVSSRHVSFLETGRARPSRDMVLHLAAGLMLPLGARNAMLQSAGFAPVFPASELDSEAIEPFRRILDEMISRHAPNPALLCDRHWNVLDASPSAGTLLSALRSDSGERNLIRLLAESPTAPDVIANLPEVLEEMAARLNLEALEAGDDPILPALLETLASAARRHPMPHGRQGRRPVLPVVVNSPDGPLSFLSAVAHFGTSEDVTVRDLRLELLFPADDRTRAAMAALGAG
ncbi:MAG: helix-turn-helix transcriptional regulator [Thalassobaculaceae bacterium]|nr:helix-turn-helix transcriptional regulator [Thalassobaculaceae bacterium]